MNELKIERWACTKQTFLSTVSAVALFVSTPLMSTAVQAGGEPPLWIEFGWHSDVVRDSRNDFSLPLGNVAIPSGSSGPLASNLSLSRSYGDEGKVSYRPSDSGWVFQAAVNYGRVKNKKRSSIDISEPLPTTSFITFHTTIPTYPVPYHRTQIKPAQVKANSLHAETISAEQHLILDFEVGRDVGLGLFGGDIESTVSVGIRVAQMKSTLTIANFRGIPDAHLSYFHSTFPTLAFFPSGPQMVPWYHMKGSQIWHAIAGNGDSAHSFRGIGPSISWDASTSVYGDPHKSGEITVNWGVNAAILYGRQKNTATHQTAESYNCYGNSRCNGQISAFKHASQTRSDKNISVPNVGGYLGLSYRIEDFKASFGYRSDFFFGALGTGFVGERSVTRGFEGPYASISVGLGG